MSLQFIVDCNPLTGRSNKSISEALSYQNIFGETRSMRRYLDRAKNAGYESFLCLFDPKILKAIQGKGEVYAVVPNAAQYVRDMNL